MMKAETLSKPSLSLPNFSMLFLLFCPISPTTQDDVYTGDDDVEMEEDEGGDLGSEEFDFEFVGELSDSIDL